MPDSRTKLESVSGVAMTDEQRRLVLGNLALVAIHLRRNVDNIAVPRRDREWDDLFQEGVLGLISAAVSYRDRNGIPFAAFALPRIQSAVSRALRRRFAAIRVPRKRVRRKSAPGAMVRSDGVSSPVPTVCSLSAVAQRYLADARGGRCSATIEALEPCETIGDRLRDKYERALAEACEFVAGADSKRGDRSKLVQALREERFMIPSNEAKRPIRQIARDTDSSYGRVAECDRQIAVRLGELLGADPEFTELYRRARVCPSGTEFHVDGELDRTLAQFSANSYADRLRRAGPLERIGLLRTWEKLVKRDIADVTRPGVLGLSSRDRERLLRYADSCASSRPRSSRTEGCRPRRAEGKPETC